MPAATKTVLVVCLGLATLLPVYAWAGAAVDLPAMDQWVDTGIDVQKGDSLGVSLNARRGKGRARRRALEATAAPAPTLSGRIGALTFAVTAKCVAPATGRLYLRVDETSTQPDAEGGTVRVSVTHVPAVSGPTVVSQKSTLSTSSSGRFVPLPDVVGMKFAAAARSLKKFRLTVRRRERSSSYPVAQVIDQSPEPGSDARAVKVVTLTVSDGLVAEVSAAPSLPPRRVPRPRKTRMAPPPEHEPSPTVPPKRSTPSPTPLYVAQPTSAPAHTARPRPRPSKPRQIGIASAQPKPTATRTPAAAAPVSPTAPSARPRPPTPSARPRPPASPVPKIPTASPGAIAVPLVIGALQGEAASTVERSRLYAIYRGTEPSRFELGRVTRTTPSAGAQVTQGSLVGYWVANGENVVPNLKGQSSGSAGALLKNSGFLLGTVVNHGGAEGRVQKQNPPAGTLARVNSAVDITIGVPGRGWVLWLIVGALLAAALGVTISSRMRLARVTSRLLTIHPSVQLEGPTSFEGSVETAGPAVHVTASLEMGEATFEDHGPLVQRKETR